MQDYTNPFRRHPHDIQNVHQTAVKKPHDEDNTRLDTDTNVRYLDIVRLCYPLPIFNDMSRVC